MEEQVKNKKPTRAELEKELNELKSKYEKLKSNYEIVVTARKEDSEKVAQAQNVLALFSQKEQELANSFEQQRNIMVNTLNEQNGTIITLFEMMDNSLNQQIYYYQKYKSVFIGIEERKPIQEQIEGVEE